MKGNKIAVSLREISKSYGGSKILNNVSFNVWEGEFLVILGPSGCGKTTLLRILAGLDEQDSGDVLFYGQNVSGLPPRKRDLGVVFQEPSLFKHMTVSQNVGFGLKVKGVPKYQIVKQVSEILDMVGLSGFESRMPNSLSGGQQQRVALARALVLKPHLLLLDEPFSALDIKTRQKLRSDLKEIQQKFGITTIFVTHDQEEAFELGDRIVVMNSGKVEHIGTPEEIYDYPKTEFVASFIGTVNVIKSRVENGKVPLGLIPLELPPGSKFNEDDPVKVLIRPENIVVEKSIKKLKSEEITTGKILNMVLLGPMVRIKVSLGHGVSLISARPKAEVSEQKLKEGDKVFVYISKYSIFPEETEILITVPITKILKV